MGILGISELIDIADKHSNRDFRDVFNGDKVSLAVLSDSEEGVVVVCVNLETILSHSLSVVEHSFDTGTIGLVIHVNLEAVSVVKFCVLADKQTLKSFTDWGKHVAEKCNSIISVPRTVEY